jgi:hypothetical protein
MDRVSESLLNKFSEEFNLALPENERFEQLAAYLTVQRHYPETFDPGDLITGAGGDTGIDAIAMIVNGALITDLEAFEEISEKANTLDVTFVFVQAATSPKFECAKIGTLGFGLLDFFKTTPSLKRNDKVVEAAEIMSAIYEDGSKFKRGNPACRVYYVTTGKWQGEADLEARRTGVINDLDALGLFRSVAFTPVDAAGLQQLYRQSKNAIAREFNFVNKTVVPDVPGVNQAYLGFLPAAEYLKIIQDDYGDVIGGLFSENPRDWLDYNAVNEEIKTTLASAARSRFVLMNNGITIIARSVRPTGNKFYIEDFSIVNGCQTSHVLSEEKDQIDESVMVPIRLIGTEDDEVMNDIIRGTNRQTEVTAEQFYALEEFSKNLETFCQAFPEQHKLYYERRTRQYHRLSIEKTRIITPANMIKAYSAMFLAEPHRTTRNYAALKAKVGTEIFAPGHFMEPYYTAAYALYILEFHFRNKKLPSKYKPARFHLLLATRMLANPDKIPPGNSHEMKRFCERIMATLWDSAQVERLLVLATAAIELAAEFNFNRDNIRTEPFTNRVIAEIEKATRALGLKN